MHQYLLNQEKINKYQTHESSMSLGHSSDNSSPQLESRDPIVLNQTDSTHMSHRSPETPHRNPEDNIKIVTISNLKTTE